MRVVNSYGKRSGMASIVFALLCVVMLFLLKFKWVHVWSIGMLVLAIIFFGVGFVRIGVRKQAQEDDYLFNTPVKHVERTFSGLTYNGKPLKHYRKVCLTHAPYPYADERKGILWLHPEHFNADKGALSVWEENGGIISEETAT